jgi:hypothetical protein
VSASYGDNTYLISRTAFATLKILIGVAVKLLKLAKRPSLAISTEVHQGKYSAMIVDT